MRPPLSSSRGRYRGSLMYCIAQKQAERTYNECVCFSSSVVALLSSNVHLQNDSAETSMYSCQHLFVTSFSFPESPYASDPYYNPTMSLCKSLCKQTTYSLPFRDKSSILESRPQNGRTSEPQYFSDPSSTTGSSTPRTPCTNQCTSTSHTAGSASTELIKNKECGLARLVAHPVQEELPTQCVFS